MSTPLTGEDYKVLFEDLQVLLRQVRKVLHAPEGQSLIIHAERIYAMANAYRISQNAQVPGASNE